jgi:glycosyltransferase involved in cell wall biosynthesis
MENLDSGVDFSVIVPCYNEADIISKTVSDIDGFINSKMPGINSEIIIVNDGSQDDTLAIAKNLASSFKRLRVHSLPYNQGRGAAMKQGIQSARGKYLMFLDADLSYDVNHLKEVYECFIQDPRLDVVVVSPYTPGGEFKNIPWQRLVVSRAANYILSGFIDDKVKTVTSMCRGYRSSIIKSTPLLEDGKELHLEILRKMIIKGVGIKEIPGRLIWKDKAARAKRQTNLKLVKSAQKHFMYGMLARPARLVKYVAYILLLIGVYEFFNVFRLMLKMYPTESAGSFAKDLWIALSQAFSISPHTVVIAITCTVFALQALTFYFLFKILDMQHRETIAHFLKLFERKTE